MSFYNKTNIIIAKVQNKKRSSIEINQSILTKLKVNDTTSKVKKLSSLNDERADTVKNIFNEQMEILRLQKAKRALLYLINIKSNGILKMKRQKIPKKRMKSIKYKKKILIN